MSRWQIITLNLRCIGGTILKYVQLFVLATGTRTEIIGFLSHVYYAHNNIIRPFECLKQRFIRRMSKIQQHCVFTRNEHPLILNIFLLTLAEVFQKGKKKKDKTSRRQKLGGKKYTAAHCSRVVYRTWMSQNCRGEVREQTIVLKARRINRCEIHYLFNPSKLEFLATRLNIISSTDSDGREMYNIYCYICVCTILSEMVWPSN